jgi:hypothetical protein
MTTISETQPSKNIRPEREPSLPSGCHSGKLADILEVKNGINFTAAQKGKNGIPTLDVFNMYTKGIRVDLGNLYRVDLKPKEDYILKNGDLLFVRSSVKRDGVGWTSLVRGQNDPVTFCGFIIRGRLREAGVSPEYLTYFLRSHPHAKRQFRVPRRLLLQISIKWRSERSKCPSRRLKSNRESWQKSRRTSRGWTPE